MSLKENVNRIHSELCDKYSVNIEEGSDREMGNFIKLSVNEGSKNLIAFVSKTELENFKNDFQFEIIKSLKSPGLTTRRGTFSISIAIEKELRKKYGINCRFSQENSEK